jgi:hypothetical protein
MAISNCMNFQIQTLIDITETGTRRQSEDKFSYKQQANFQTVLQTIGMRVNLNYENSPGFGSITINKMNFGDKYIGKQNIWTFNFSIDYEGGLDLQMLKNDFDLIPIITGLTETAQLDKALFRTTGKDKNIIFSIVD